MGDPNKTGRKDSVSTTEWVKSTAKNPDDFDESGEQMTEEQAEHLRLLSKEAKLPFTETLTRAEAERRIDELQRMTGNKP